MRSRLHHSGILHGVYGDGCATNTVPPELLKIRLQENDNPGCYRVDNRNPDEGSTVRKHNHPQDEQDQEDLDNLKEACAGGSLFTLNNLVIFLRASGFKT